MCCLMSFSEVRAGQYRDIIDILMSLDIVLDFGYRYIAIYTVK